MKRRSTLLILLLLAAVLTACGSPTAAPAAEMMDEKAPSDEIMEDDMRTHETPTPEGMLPEEVAPAAEAVMESPAWFDAAFTDARAGGTFRLNDFKGKVVLVETMAVWCSNCFKQQTEIRGLHDLLGERDDFVSLSLDIDPNEDAATLGAFANQNGFDWLYAVAPPEVAREIAGAYGDQFLNPPSTPVLIVDRHGVAHPLPFGIKSAEDLLQAVQPYLDESM